MDRWVNGRMLPQPILSSTDLQGQVAEHLPNLHGLPRPAHRLQLGAEPLHRPISRWMGGDGETRQQA